jgi:acylphosphatase
VSTKAVDVVVAGTVQGVFFRASCAGHADQLGVTGWVGNGQDGTVVGHFEGSPEAVDALVAWCRSGPPRATVTAVDVAEVEAQHLQRFDARGGARGGAGTPTPW